MRMAIRTPTPGAAVPPAARCWSSAPATKRWPCATCRRRTTTASSPPAPQVRLSNCTGGPSQHQSTRGQCLSLVPQACPHPQRHSTARSSAGQLREPLHPPPALQVLSSWWRRRSPGRPTACSRTPWTTTTVWWACGRRRSPRAQPPRPRCPPATRKVWGSHHNG
jgi:hypothetical protein